MSLHPDDVVTDSDRALVVISGGAGHVRGMSDRSVRKAQAMEQRRADDEAFSGHADDEPRDALSLLLGESAPEVSASSPERSRALAELVVATGRAAGAGGMRRRAPRVMVMAGAGVLVLAGAGAAAAASGTWVPPWDRKPVAEFSYTLPSGTQCATRIESITVNPGSPETVRDVEHYLAGRRLTFQLTESDVAAAVPDASSSASIAADGTTSVTSAPVDPGALSEADYRASANHAASEAFINALAQAGLPGVGYSGASACQS
jgi:hypothetical protein